MKNSALMPSQTRDSGVPSFPAYLQIETVSVCNARCTMCLTSQCQRERSLMTDAIFEEIADELKGYASDIKRVTIQGAGEPLLDKKLESRISHLKANQLAFVAFATNGSLMDEKRARSVLMSGVDEVSFSVDGVTKETYEAIRQGLSFDEVVANIESFVALRNELSRSTIIRLRMTVQNANQHELEPFMAYWKKRLGPRDAAYAKVIHTWGNSQELKERPEHYDYDRINALPCESPWTSMIVFSDGRVPLCCCDYNAQIFLGRVGEQSLVEIWRGPILCEVRNRHIQEGRKSIPLCVNCMVWDNLAKIESVD